MGALALVRPFLNIVGVMERLGGVIGVVGSTLLISLVWLLIVVGADIRHPILTLVFTGMAYGVFAIAISAILSPMLTGQLQGPITHIFATVAVLITNAFWGGTVGLVALAFQRMRRP
jgi:hypothetical protein